jgi:hypothetical protein
MMSGIKAVQADGTEKDRVWSSAEVPLKKVQLSAQSNHLDLDLAQNLFSLFFHK